MAKKQSNPIISYDARIGNVSAENDYDFLNNCFVSHRAVSEIMDLESAKMILAGRTGAGKTAILKHIEEKNRKTSEIIPSDMSMHYISNSDIIRFLDDIGANLDMFFQTLWKHVLIIEYIKMKYHSNSEPNSTYLFDKILDFFASDHKRKIAEQYIEKWGSVFWITMDESIRSLTETYERNITAELGVDVNKFKTKAGYGQNLSAQQKSEFVARARKVIDSGQLAALSSVIEALSNGSKETNRGRTYYILIDQLDLNWAEERIRFRLINALIQTLQKFRKIHDLKIIVALRSDVLERTKQENDELGFQSEKYKDYISEIRWSTRELNELLQKRINYLFRKKYTKDNVCFDDIFSHEIKRKKSLDYILARTLFRPRDAIAFVNECLKEADGASEITPKHINAAELAYAVDRKQALIEEWKSAYPSLASLLSVLENRSDVLLFSEFSSKQNMEALAYRIADKDKEAFDPLFVAAEKVAFWTAEQRGDPYDELARKSLVVLYRVGVVGLKLSSEIPYSYSHLGASSISESSFKHDTKIRIHEMLHRSLNIYSGNKNKHQHRSYETS
ncbi:P-loop ATPase, Sll1717 family [Pseudovibrio axinellae]|uniref:P-loop ATPase, Sll1717 family n=1 Tax=Pseudovibrio axinellae TaxID=989403 RepID=UPI0011146120|nr:hypothetical protein [Pseudovibrio axinellae]